jgi:hypothetical protein
MDAAEKRIVDLVLKLVGEQLGEQLCEIRALRRDLEHAKAADWPARITGAR